MAFWFSFIDLRICKSMLSNKSEKLLSISLLVMRTVSLICRCTAWASIISSISCHAASRSEHPNYLSKTCFLFLTCYCLIMDRAILQCTIPSIQQFPAITNETRENIIINAQNINYIENCIIWEFLVIISVLVERMIFLEKEVWDIYFLHHTQMSFLNSSISLAFVLCT